MRMCELRQKEVVNICTGKRLGCIVDVEIDVRCGEVEAVIIPGPERSAVFSGQTANTCSRFRVSAG